MVLEEMYENQSFFECSFTFFRLFLYKSLCRFFFSDRVLKAYPKTGITGYDFSDE